MKKERLAEYINGLKTLEKVIRILNKNNIYYYSASYHVGASIHIEVTDFDLTSIFNITRTELNGNLIYNYIDVNGIEVKIII